jgi:hypothetical protein
MATKAFVIMACSGTDGLALRLSGGLPKSRMATAAERARLGEREGRGWANGRGAAGRTGGARLGEREADGT